MNNNPSENKFDFDSLFKEVKTISEVPLDLPSKGNFYKGSNVYLRPMTFEDEKAMVLSRNNKGDPVNELLSRCVRGISINTLLLMDKLYILLKLREISYKEEYEITLACQSCNKDNNLIFRMSDLTTTYMEEGQSELRELTLPKTKVKLKVRYPRVEDEPFLKSEALILDNTWRFIVSVNDSDDPIIISKFVKDPRMPLADSHYLMEFIFKATYGIDTLIKYNCDGCLYQNIDNLPISSNFFTMS